MVQDHSEASKNPNGLQAPEPAYQFRTPRVTWEQYSSWTLKGNDLYIGRRPVLKIQSRDIKLSVSMVILIFSP